jgi:hypothetical protein
LENISIIEKVTVFFDFLDQNFTFFRYNMEILTKFKHLEKNLILPILGVFFYYQKKGAVMLLWTNATCYKSSATFRGPFALALSLFLLFSVF